MEFNPDTMDEESFRAGYIAGYMAGEKRIPRVYTKTVFNDQNLMAGIERYCKERDNPFFECRDIARFMGHITDGQADHMSRRIASTLKRMGYQRKRKKISGHSVWGWTNHHALERLALKTNPADPSDKPLL